MTNRSRRALLEGSLFAGVAALAGCLDTGATGSAGGGDRTETETGTEEGTETETESGDASSGPLYETWLPGSVEDPFAEGTIDRRETAFRYVDYADVRAASETLPESDDGSLREVGRVGDEFGIDFADATAKLEFADAVVLEGTFDPADAIDDVGYGERDEYEGYNLYRDLSSGAFAGGTVAVGPSTLAVTAGGGPSGDGAPAGIEAVIDAHLGTAERAAEVADGAVATLLSGIDGSSYLVCRTVADGSSLPNGTIGTLFSWEIGPDETELTLGFAFDDEDAVDAARIEEVLEGSSFAEYDDRATATDGRLVTVTGTTPTAEFEARLGSGSSRPAAPQVGLTFEEGDEGVTITVVAISRADSLIVQADGEEYADLEPRAGARIELSREEGEIESGDVVTVIGEYDGNEAVVAQYEVGP